MGLEAARKLVQRFRVGSGSNRGIPVADVVVLQVLVDILLNMLGAIGLLPLWMGQIQEKIHSKIQKVEKWLEEDREEDKEVRDRRQRDKEGLSYLV